MNAVAQASFLSVAPFVGYLLVLGVQYPRPSWHMWNVYLLYMAVVVVVKFLFQIPVRLAPCCIGVE